MARVITDLGEIGATSGVLRPLDFPLRRGTSGAVWDLTGYTNPRLSVWDYRTKTVVALAGTTSILDAANGIVRYAPTASDPLYANSGIYEGRIWVTPGGVGDPEPSGFFRFQIGDGPA